MTWRGSFEVCSIRKRNIPWMPEGGAQSKGKDHVYNGQKREILKTFWAFTQYPFFSFFSILFWRMGSNTFWNKQPSFFPPCREKINKSSTEGNQFNNVQVSETSALGKSHTHSLQSLISFVCKWTYTVGLASNDAEGTVKESAQDNHYFKEAFGLLQIPLYVYFLRQNGILIGSFHN